MEFIWTENLLITLVDYCGTILISDCSAVSHGEGEEAAGPRHRDGGQAGWPPGLRRWPPEVHHAPGKVVWTVRKRKVPAGAKGKPAGARGKPAGGGKLFPEVWGPPDVRRLAAEVER